MHHSVPLQHELLICIDTQAHTQWEVTSGYVECARISIPKLTNLKTEPCSLELEGLLFRYVLIQLAVLRA